MKKNLKKDTALVLSSGGLAGAISAGFVATICRELGINHFSTIYCYSVGVYPGTFGVANQPDVIENVWRNKIDGSKLVKKWNFLTFGTKKMLDLEYLEKLFSRGKNKLNINRVFKSKIKLIYVLMEKETGKVKFIKPDRKNILDLMNAACAVPVIHGLCKVDGVEYVDPSFVYGSSPKLDEIIKKHKKIVFVSNYPRKYKRYTDSFSTITIKKLLFPLFAKLYPQPLQKIFEKRKKLVEREVELLKNPKIILTSPSKLPLSSSRDTNKKRINRTFDIGVRLAKDYIKIIKGI